jgi:2-amino-4-hydroxy-6-hydroxymethyldihydropteridine diphosphokinase
LARARCELEQAGVRIVCVSNLYSTKPLGDAPQPRYLNAVLLADARLAPAALLRLLKQIERRAGRKTTRVGPRSLDIDILHFGGRQLGWPVRRRERGRLILPHPEMHGRAFVLVPLLEVAAGWRHPILDRSAKALLARLTPAARAGVGQALDFAADTCEKHES